MKQFGPVGAPEGPHWKGPIPSSLPRLCMATCAGLGLTSGYKTLSHWLLGFLGKEGTFGTVKVGS